MTAPHRAIPIGSIPAPAPSAPASPAPHFLTRAGGRLACDDGGGAGPLAIAIPGMGELRAQYRLLRPALILMPRPPIRA